ncbi:hypothetical protein [Ktedonobacter racemifer]|uniref:Uncharacterized protein n=1 Tax=Ktedonobacter racemifer DSM 44963 TaxID=485913 RepID=D6TX93_KTERA|nr:hypothetical protein [Ktedonobacter racemifer]EFH84826.1 hypothetical protein Krac_5937 [Ktedonobacter racemifer DSM 44963]
MLTNEGKRIGKGRQGFAVLSRLPNRKHLPSQQLMSKNGDERKQSQQCRSRARNRQIRPLALRLDPQMVTYLMKGHFQRPAQDKLRHHLGCIGVLISAQQGCGLVLALRVANEHSPDGNRRNRRLIPQRCARGDFHLACRSPIPGQRVFLPRRAGIAEPRSQLGLGFALVGSATTFSSGASRGRIVETGIQAQTRDEARVGQARDVIPPY